MIVLSPAKLDGRLARIGVKDVVPQRSEQTCRRSGRRYPIAANLRYLVCGEGIRDEGYGQTVDLSSSGVLFQADHALPTGVEIEIAIAWPARTRLHRGGVTVRVKAQIVRASGQCIAAKIIAWDINIEPPQPHIVSESEN